MADAEREMYDSIMHTKSKGDGTDAVHEKEEFPMTRYSNVLGAPHLMPLENVKDAFPDEYLLATVGEIVLSDVEYNRCFGDLTTV